MSAEGEVKAATEVPKEETVTEEKKTEETTEADGDKKKKEKKEKKPKGEGKAKEGKGKKGDGKGKDGKTGSGPFGGGSGYRLNVKNIGETTEAELKALFEAFGTVTMAQVKLDDNGKSRGFGFVVLSSQEEGEKAAAEMNGKDHNGKELSVGAATRRDPPEGEVKGGKAVKGKGKGAAPQADLQAQQMYMQQIAYMQHAAYMQQMYMQTMYMQQAQAYQEPAPMPSQEYEGSLKSVSARNSYGFIVCAQTEAMFSRDVYVDQADLPEGAQRGDRLIFTFELSEKTGHPKAKTCRRAI